MVGDRLVGILGAVAIILAAAGVAVVEARTGPFEHTVGPPAPSAELSGSLTSSGGQDPTGNTGLCGQTGSQPACSEEEIHLELTVQGLPELPEGAAYAAFLVGEGSELAFGALDARQGEHRLSATRAGELDRYAALALVLTDRQRPETMTDLVLGQIELDDAGGGTAAVAQSLATNVGELQGDLSTAQVGLFEVSALADARVTGLPVEDGWTYRAWFLDGAGRPIALGELVVEGEAHVLDSRVERVELELQDRFVVSLEPTTHPMGAGPAGPLVVDLPLTTG